jgi:hypothetical protein
LASGRVWFWRGVAVDGCGFLLLILGLDCVAGCFFFFLAQVIFIYLLPHY